MRTTVNLPDDVYQAARSVAKVNRVSLGEALARRGMRREVSIRTDEAFPCFDIPEDSPPITLEQTLKAQEEL